MKRLFVLLAVAILFTGCSQITDSTTYTGTVSREALPLVQGSDPCVVQTEHWQYTLVTDTGTYALDDWYSGMLRHTLRITGSTDTTTNGLAHISVIVYQDISCE